MGNLTLSPSAQASFTLPYRFTRCCICFVSIDRLRFDEESSPEDDEPVEIIKCRNNECARIFHRHCLKKHFKSVGAKTCPGCGWKIVDGKIVLETSSEWESTPTPPSS